MSQIAIPYYFFRGGTSRGPFFNRADLPDDREAISRVLIAALGSGHILNIDGIGGGNAVTTKVAILSKSTEESVDVDYLFAQVGVTNRQVDFKPTCGNMMVAVGPAAIEMGLVEAQQKTTDVSIRAVNTGARVIAKVQTPDGQVCYEGDTHVDGVPGTAAAIELDFQDVVGAATGKLLPTGNPVDEVEGVKVTCMDVAMPMVIAQAESFGLTGAESAEELNADRDFFSRMESVRLTAAKLMGMGDCSNSVTPKFGLVSKAVDGGSLQVRYFMPWEAHPALAVTGSQCLCACALTPGTVAAGLLRQDTRSPARMQLEHPMGAMEVVMKFNRSGNDIQHQSAGIIRTARKIARGEVFVPASVVR
ncbi:MAG: 4-oxalomesaconate tautomerase [Gammaproteobacteria bacterium]|nr:4-oxalomesaconate tautomerase [Gammaproteobacteria bacterium]